MKLTMLLLAPLPEIISPLAVVLVVDKWGQSTLIEPNGVSARVMGNWELVLLKETSDPLSTLEGVLKSSRLVGSKIPVGSIRSILSAKSRRAPRLKLPSGPVVVNPPPDAKVAPVWIWRVSVVLL